MSHVITQEVDAPTLARAQGRWSGPAAAGASAHDGGESMDVCSCIIAQGAARGRWTASHAPQAHRLPLTGSRKRREHGSCWLACQGRPYSISRVAPPRVPGLHRHFTGLPPAVGSLHSFQPQARRLPLTGRTGGGERVQRGSFVCSFVAGHVHSRVAPLVCACTRPITPPPYTMIVLESESAREGKCGLVLRRRLHARTVTTLCML